MTQEDTGRFLERTFTNLEAVFCDPTGVPVKLASLGILFGLAAPVGLLESSISILQSMGYENN